MIGKWEASFEMSEEDLAKMTPADNPIVSEIGKILMKSIRAEMGWEFASDNTVTASATLLGNSVIRRGSWRFLSGDETTTKITVQFENEEPRELSFTFSDPDTLEVVPITSGKWQLTRMVKFKRVAATP